MTASEALEAVIIMGPPGAGKGTQAQLLGEKLDLWHLESSKVLEEWFRNAHAAEFLEVEGKKYYAADEKKLWEDGILLSPPLVARLIQEKIREIHRAGESVLTSGSPRTLYEAERVYPLLEELYGKQNVRVILLEVSEEESVARNSHRRICELMRHPILYSQETISLTACPLDGSRLVTRTLDDAETIKVRLGEYRERTYPILQYLEKQGLRITRINGNQTVEQVFKEVEAAVLARA
jgi:adenylate kinase